LLTILKMALSIGFRDSIPLLSAIQATRLLTFTSVGLSPTERASLSWSHNRACSYQCHLSGGKHTCIEKDIEIVPLKKIVTVLPQDTFGISKILSDYRGKQHFKSSTILQRSGNQPLLLNNDPESQTPQLNRKGQNRPGDSSNFESCQSRNRSC
jgi:hypothetical protein